MDTAASAFAAAVVNCAQDGRTDLTRRGAAATVVVPGVSRPWRMKEKSRTL